MQYPSSPLFFFIFLLGYFDAASPTSIILLITSLYSSPTPAIILGKRLTEVKPGMVFISLNTIWPSGVRNMSNLA